ncbi:Coenzyme F420 hydrogenase/dehydrogenase, beta subunit C-terminal domain [Phenylobacterium sp.]|uniref:Coenzyme F420 hydrogenase/dehydrogenase, beta subunit C-terminal domain n=1 Tax=Phenylobacterium sp. TaxID=1871053 RepID=UPI00289D5B85|nr:Coenzyme F420 hydrogenase/dehydrogenase, beta subunit C-terminal domain [Phenylobacterium sp.]
MALPASPTVERVLRGQLCTGCGLCAAVSDGAIGMRMTPPGYSRPIQSAPISDAAEATIAQSCPGAVVAPWGRAENLHPYWGPWRGVWTGYATDAAVRFEGSSGGALSAILIHALATGLVDRVLHIKADPEKPTANVTVCSTTPEEVIAGAGSRYTASSPLSQIDEALAAGGRMAFVGKPCDVSALRRLALGDPRVDRHVPLMLSFFCGGMPSHDGVHRMLDTMDVRFDEVAAFRYRGQGWPGTAAATTHDGRVATMSYADSWGAHLSKEVQFRCKICPDAVGGVADIACADAWYGGESGYPSFDEQDGRSLIVVRSEAGARAFQSAVDGCALSVETLDVGEIDLMQPSQARRKRLVHARLGALTATLQPKPDMRGTEVSEAARRAPPTEAARNLVGTVRRVLLGKR